jgi:hypothetical protein
MAETRAVASVPIYRPRRVRAPSLPVGSLPLEVDLDEDVDGFSDREEDDRQDDGGYDRKHRFELDGREQGSGRADPRDEDVLYVVHIVSFWRPHVNEVGSLESDVPPLLTCGLVHLPPAVSRG